jgi:hypothetical protein
MTPEYKRAYERGWRYSGTETATLDYGDESHQPEPWYDGYLDRAAGRAKWHLATCPNHGVGPGTCGEG